LALEKVLEPILAAARTATASPLLTLQPDLNDIARASHARGKRNGLDHTILGAGPTFHASVEIDNMGLATIKGQHPVGTYLDAVTATHAFLFIKGQCGHIVQVSQ